LIDSRLVLAALRGRVADEEVSRGHVLHDTFYG
jgi:hypothetical protein